MSDRVACLRLLVFGAAAAIVGCVESGSIGNNQDSGSDVMQMMGGDAADHATIGDAACNCGPGMMCAYAVGACGAAPSCQPLPSACRGAPYAACTCGGQQVTVPACWGNYAPEPITGSLSCYPDGGVGDVATTDGAGCQGSAPLCFGDDTSTCCGQDPAGLAMCQNGQWMCGAAAAPGCNGVSCLLGQDGGADAGAPCTQDSDCAGGLSCAYALNGGCSAPLTCVSLAGTCLAADVPACACDGQRINVHCGMMGTRTPINPGDTSCFQDGGLAGPGGACDNGQQGCALGLDCLENPNGLVASCANTGVTCDYATGIALTCGGISCAPGQVCVLSETVGGGNHSPPDDAGLCPSGTWSSPFASGECSPLAAYACAPLPVACTAGASPQTCFAPLCTGNNTLSNWSGCEVDCIFGAP